MFDFNQYTLNGRRVSYSALPDYLLNQVEADNRLNPTDKLVFIRLLRYACHVKSSVMTITGSWIANTLGLHRNTANKSIRVLKQLGYLTDKGLNLTPSNAQESSGKTADLVNQALALVGSKKHKEYANTAQETGNAQDLTPPKDCANMAQNEFLQDLCMPKGCAENGTSLVHSIKNNCKSKQDTNLSCDIGWEVAAVSDSGAVGVALPVYASFSELEAAPKMGADFGFSSDAMLMGRLVGVVDSVGGVRHA